jgi:hypothetical protein
LSRDPLGELTGENPYKYADDDPVGNLDPDGYAKIKVNGQIWETPIVGDRLHVHLFNGVDQGVHLHGPGGLKYFPETQMFMDRYGNWSQANQKFVNAFTEAAERKFSAPIAEILARWRGLAAITVIGLFLSAESMAQQMIRDLLMYSQDCQGKHFNDDAWALVELLDMRAGMNAQSPFTGDLAMRVVLKASEGCGQH